MVSLGYGTGLESIFLGAALSINSSAILQFTLFWFYL